MMLKVALLASSACAFVQQSMPLQSSTLRAGAEELVGVDVEHKILLGGDYMYDPLG